jgi:hypothetical protein
MKRDMNVKSNGRSGMQNYRHHLGNEGVIRSHREEMAFLIL